MLPVPLVVHAAVVAGIEEPVLQYELVAGIRTIVILHPLDEGVDVGVGEDLPQRG